jgi:hypothetical protein
MPDESRENDQEAAEQGQPSADRRNQPPAVDSRRPYSAPRLRRLGSVAELTFAGGSHALDSGPHSTAKSKG